MDKNGGRGDFEGIRASLLSLLGALSVSAGFLVLAYEQYWLSGTSLPPSFLTVVYQLECVGYGFLGAGVLLLGTSWTMARSHRPRVSAAQSVFDRYRPNWGVEIGTLGYFVTAIGLLVVVVADAGLLVGVTIIRRPVYYTVNESITGIGIAVWGIGAFLDRISST